jgi:hypothetical protein
MSYCLVGLLCKILGVYNLGILAYSMCVLGLCGFLYTIYLTPIDGAMVQHVPRPHDPSS